ncbi:hypothetical protein JCM10212_006311 [Sporobolomyces blumeae]
MVEIELDDEECERAEADEGESEGSEGETESRVDGPERTLVGDCDVRRVKDGINDDTEDVGDDRDEIRGDAVDEAPALIWAKRSVAALAFRPCRPGS